MSKVDNDTTAIDNTGNYNLASVSYDRNGNITNLQRKGHLNSELSRYNYQRRRWDKAGYKNLNISLQSEVMWKTTVSQALDKSVGTSNKHFKLCIQSRE